MRHAVGLELRRRRIARAGATLAMVVVVVCAAVGVVAGPGVGTAVAQVGPERIVSYDVTITIENSGDLLIREVIDYDFGVLSKHGIFREIPNRFDYEPKSGYDRVYPIHVDSVTGSPGTPTQYETSEEGDIYRIKIGDPDRAIDGRHTYDITYRVEGALNGFDDHDELYWNAIGDEWAVTIESSRVVVNAPGPVTAINCFSGPDGGTLPCGPTAVEGNTAAFGHPQFGLFPYVGVTVVVAFPTGLVPTPKPILEERFSFTSAFRATTGTISVGIGMLVAILLGIAALVFFLGRDRRYRGSAVDVAFGSADGADETAPVRQREVPVQFEPPDGLRPGQVGTLVDFTAHPLDVTATIVDLAVRGYLRIEEIDGAGWLSKGDWKMTKLRDADDDLLEYERSLLNGLFTSGDEVTVSGLRQKFAERMQKVRTALEADAKARGWFRGNPGTRRALWFGAGILLLAAGIALTVFLAIFTHAALVGIGVIVGGIVLCFASKWMPRRTAKGYAMLQRTNGFRRFIEESEKHRAEFAERANLFTEYLPYAVVFGATEKWAKAFEGLADLPDTSFYVSAHGFHPVAFSHAIDGFSVTSVGSLSSSPPSSSGGSGFSGGSSGGGGGGGGGGSW